MTPEGLVEVTEFDTKDGIYDCAWSEVRAVERWSAGVPVLFATQAR